MRAPLLSTLLLLGASTVSAQVAPPQDSMAQRMQACTPCHGRQGQATREGYYPRIAGKPAAYLHDQLRDFQTGRRQNATMTYLVEHMSDDYLREIAQYFADLDLPYPPPESHNAPPRLLERGRQLSLEGDRAKAIPACSSCHGERLTGVQPSMPGIAGLPSAYVGAQLGAWKTGHRKARAPDCMADIVQRMSLDDIGAVSVWLSMRPLNADASPARSSGSAQAPLECGSGLK